MSIQSPRDDGLTHLKTRRERMRDAVASQSEVLAEMGAVIRHEIEEGIVDKEARFAFEVDTKRYLELLNVAAWYQGRNAHEKMRAMFLHAAMRAVETEECDPGH